MKKYFPYLVAGFGASVLSVVPVIKSFTCCLIIPAAAFFALILEQKANGRFQKIEMSKALIAGLLTGLTSAIFGSFFELFITFITKSNDIVIAFGEFQSMINNFPFDETMKQEMINLIAGIIEDIQDSGFSIFYTITVLFNNFFVNIIFGTLGGLIGGQILNGKMKKDGRTC